MLCHELRLLFIDICKNAGTAITFAFKRAYPRYKFRGKHHSIKNYTPGISSMLTDKIIDGYVTFAVVRNPYDRMVSLWLWGSRSDYINTTFGQFLKNVKNGKYVEYSRIRYRTQVDWITDKSGRVRVDHIIRYENLKEELDNFCKSNGFSQLNLKPMNTAREKSKFPRLPYRSYYKNKWMIDIVTEMYAEDLKMFGYTF